MLGFNVLTVVTLQSLIILHQEPRTFILHWAPQITELEGPENPVATMGSD